ncbi:MAG TPA: DUF1015 domain-containing protein [Armatimonadota bacterium]|nr:DUF1015 domain-containing protein [Armatimonadota bacterium]
MADAERILHPFRGIRYGTNESPDLSKLIAPPYDVISEEKQAELNARSEHNFVRIELPQGATETRYAQAAALLPQWLSEGVLAREADPAFYLLEQEFTVESRRWRRRGVFGLVRLPEEEESYVLSHEGTLPEPKADRLLLMRACRAMTSPIMLMAEDGDGALMRLLAGVTGEPGAAARDSDGTVHKLWVVRDSAMVAALSGAIGLGPLYIADGHHRFETASAYRDEMCRARPAASPDAGYNYALVLVNSAQDEGLRIFPTHRLISGLDETAWERLRECMGRHFEVSTELVDEVGRGADLSWLEGTTPGRPVFGVYRDSQLYHLAAKDSAVPAGAGVVDRLDVSVLHRRLIEPMRAGAGGSSSGRISHDSHAAGRAEPGARLTYTTDAREAMAAVDRGDYDLAFFLRPTRVSEVMAAARAGERMPGKSTYFYPKIPAGLVVSDASEEPI